TLTSNKRQFDFQIRQKRIYFVIVIDCNFPVFGSIDLNLRSVNIGKKLYIRNRRHIGLIFCRKMETLFNPLSLQCCM
ncbi:MAG: hypothetical protein ACLUIO_24915, partial [Neglectibacter timonensis]